MTGSELPAAFALAGGEGERLDFGPGSLVVRVSAATTGGAFTMLEEVEPLLDTPRHVHERRMSSTSCLRASTSTNAVISS